MLVAAMTTRFTIDATAAMLSTSPIAHTSTMMLLAINITHAAIVVPSAMMATATHATAHRRTASHAAAIATGSALLVLLCLLLVATLLLRSILMWPLLIATSLLSG
jgi:hypothetical protein